VADGPTKGEVNQVHAKLAALQLGGIDVTAVATAIAGQLRPVIELVPGMVDANTRDAIADLAEGGAAAVRTVA
jgi:hypothetical protein